MDPLDLLQDARRKLEFVAAQLDQVHALLADRAPEHASDPIFLVSTNVLEIPSGQYPNSCIDDRLRSFAPAVLVDERSDGGVRFGECRTYAWSSLSDGTRIFLRLLVAAAQRCGALYHVDVYNAHESSASDLRRFSQKQKCLANRELDGHLDQFLVHKKPGYEIHPDFTFVWVRPPGPSRLVPTK